MTLRETFEAAPELYDRVRPGYPAQLFDDLAELADLRAGSRVLELGPGGAGDRVARRLRGLAAAGRAVRRRRRRDVVHWIDPAARARKSAGALRPGGALAVVSAHHIEGGDERFFADAQRCYERWDRQTPPGGVTLPAAADIPGERELTYSAAEYRDLLLSYSGHRAMEPHARARLLACITRLIDERHGGRIAKRCMHELAVARTP